MDGLGAINEQQFENMVMVSGESLYFCVEFTRIYRQYWCNIFVRKAIFHYSNRTIVMNEEDFFIGYPGFNFNIEILSQHYIKKSTYTSFIFEFVVETSS